MKKYLWLAPAALAFALAGCGGGGGAAGSGNSIALGRAALNSLSSGTQPATTSTLQSAVTLFQQALQQNSSDPNANFGSAICLGGLVSQEMDGLNGTSGSAGGSSSGSGGGSSSGSSTITPPAPPVAGSGTATTVTNTSSSIYPPLPPNVQGVDQPVPDHHVSGLLWNLVGTVNSPYALLNMLAPVADLRFGLMPFFGYQTDNPAGRIQMLAQLNQVDQQLTTVEADPTFTWTLTLDNGTTATVGLPEVELFHAYVDSMRVELSLSLAYIRTANVTSGSTVVPAVYLPTPPKDLNGDGKLEPNEYLPPSPYLTLRSATYFTTAQQALEGVASEEKAGIAGVLARPADGSGGYLVPNTTAINQALTNAQNNTLPLIQQAATGPVTLQIPLYASEPSFFRPEARSTVYVSRDSSTGEDIGLMPFDNGGGSTAYATGTTTTSTAPSLVSVTIDIAAWFANPPADLKVFAPTYPLDSNGYPIISQAVYPDPTFGGLYPNGLPSQLQF